jgi:hypothetical protein
MVIKTKKLGRGDLGRFKPEVPNASRSEEIK